MACPYSEHRREADDRTFDTARACCLAIKEFVQPMRAGICNDRYDLDHTADCEFYHDAESEGENA